MVGFNNFFRYDAELVAVYRRFGAQPFFYREVADVVSQRVLAHLVNRGYFVLHESHLKGRVKSNRWRLPDAIVERCERALQQEAACSPAA